MSIKKYIPNTITSMNALSGSVGVVFALQGRPDLAFIMLLAAAVFDFCDGLAARLLKAYSPMGKELDSLSDMVSFGVLPAMMLIGTMQIKHVEGWMQAVPLFLAVMSALRLAKFNVDERQTTDFIGVATPTAAIICGSLCYFACKSDAADFLVATTWFLPVLAVVLGLLLVSEIPMFGMKVAPGHKLLDAKRIVFLGFVVVAAVFVAVAGLNWSLAVLLVFVFYLIENLILYILPKK